MTGKRIGYIRVSTIDQNPDRQLVDIELDKKFIDHASARSTARPQLQIMLDFVREDDIVIVHSMDRLARNVIDLRQLIDKIISKGAQVHFIKENLVFDGKNNSMSNLLLFIIGAVAEFELSFLRERQREGIAEARKHRKYEGRKKKLNATQRECLVKEFETTRISKGKLATKYGISMPTLYKYLYENPFKEKVI